MSKKTQTKNELKLSPPWATYYNMLAAVFADDEDVVVNPYTDPKDGVMTITVEVKSYPKYAALKEILIDKVVMGNITIKVDLVNDVPLEDVDKYLAETAFAGNKYFDSVVTTTDPMQRSHSFIVLNNQIVQFYNDDISDYCGNYTSLPKEVFENLFKMKAGIPFNQANERTAD